MPSVRPRPPRGLTLIEIAIVMAITAVLGLMGLPGVLHTLRTHQLKAGAHGLQADVARGRQQAIDQGLDLHVQFHPGSDWCYALSLGSPADCTRRTSPRHALKIVRAEDHPTLRLMAASPMHIQARDGRAELPAGQARFTGPDGQTLAIQLGPTGRATVCSPGPEVTRVPPCQLPLLPE